jgi:hypothetical protein
MLVGYASLWEPSPTVRAYQSIQAVATPTLVQHGAGPNTTGSPGEPIDGYRFRLPNGSLAGNALCFAIHHHQNDLVTVAISDDRSNAWTTGPVNTDTFNSYTIRTFFALNVAANTRLITATFTGGTLQHVSACGSEFYNVATAAALDGSNSFSPGSGTTFTNWATGSFTTTAAGDLIWYFGVVQDVSIPPAASYTVGSGFTFLSVDIVQGMVAQYQVQGAAGPINPTVTSTTAVSYNAAAFALKAAVAGTAPSGIRVQRLHQLRAADNTTSQVFQIPCTGNLVVISAHSGGATTGHHIATLADSNANVYTQITGSPKQFPTGDTWAELRYAVNPTVSHTLTLTVTWPASTIAIQVVVWDIAGADPVAPFDASGVSNGTQTATGNLTTSSVTVAGAGEVVISGGDQFDSTCIGLVGAGFLFDPPTWPAQNENAGIGGAQNFFTDDAAAGHFYTLAPGTVTFVWTFTVGPGTGVGQWSNVAAAFKAPAVAGDMAASRESLVYVE